MPEAFKCALDLFHGTVNGGAAAEKVYDHEKQREQNDVEENHRCNGANFVGCELNARQKEQHRAGDNERNKGKEAEKVQKEGHDRPTKPLFDGLLFHCLLTAL